MLKESLQLLLTSAKSISLLKYLYNNTHVQWIALLLAGRTHQSKAEKGIFTIFVLTTVTIHHKNETCCSLAQINRDLSSSVLKIFRSNYTTSHFHIWLLQWTKKLCIYQVRITSASIHFCFLRKLPRSQISVQIMRKCWYLDTISRFLQTHPYLTKLLQDNMWIFGDHCEKTLHLF